MSSECMFEPMFSLVSDTQGGYSEKFNDYDSTYVYTVHGTLADDIRKFWDLDDEDEIFLTEEVTVNGYSEYTRDDVHVFAISALSNEVDFTSIYGCEKYFTKLSDI